MAGLKHLLKTVLSPYITGPILLSLLLLPERIRNITSPQFEQILFSPRFSFILKVLFSTTSLSKLNNYFSRLSANNFVVDKTWDWSKEIVLITGGSSGIGASIANKLAIRGIRVVNLDLTPPKESCRRQSL